jgi:DNA-binding GntR family transcriptional regulator
VPPSTTKADEIALVLEDAILCGELSPGVVLRQEELSEQFGVSRTPIREALRRLRALGLVAFAGKRGVQVRPLARRELFETFVVRAALEGFAAELARPRLNESDLDEMREGQQRFAELTAALRAATGDEHGVRSIAADWVHANEQFHDVYLRAAGVAKLFDEAKRARRVFYGQALWSPSPELSKLYSMNLEQHARIVEAFAARNIQVRKLVEQHILDSGQLLEEALDQVGYGRFGALATRVSWSRQFTTRE